MFRLYMAIGEYGQAANTAILIANQEQKIGNYQVAHSMLFETHQDLVQHKIPIPAGLSKNLLLLHSYILVKKLVKANDHVAAARMLIRFLFSWCSTVQVCHVVKIICFLQSRQVHLEIPESRRPYLDVDGQALIRLCSGR